MNIDTIIQKQAQFLYKPSSPILVGPTTGSPPSIIHISTVQNDLRGTTATNGTLAYVDGYYTPGDGGGGEFIYTTTGGPYTDDGGSILQVNNNANTVWMRIPIADTNVLWFGATPNNPSGISANNNAFQNAVYYAGRKNLGLFVPGGVYSLSNTINNTFSGTNLPLYMYGDGNQSVLDYSGATASISSILSITGSLLSGSTTGTTYAFSSGSAGSQNITFSTPTSFKDGDVVVIHNGATGSFSGFKADWQSGEFVQIAKESNGTTAFNLTKPLYDSYTGSVSTRAYKLDSVRVSLRDFRIVTPPFTNVTSVVNMSFLADPIIQNISIQCSALYGLFMDRCFRSSLLNLYINNRGTTHNNSETEYALNISNCQHTHVLGGYFYGYRHAIAQGGGSNGNPAIVPTRDTQVTNALLENVGSGTTFGICSADFHGNVALSTYKNCTIHGGVSFSGKDNGYYNCYISGGYRGNLVYSDSILGGTFVLDGCKLFSTEAPGTTDGLGFIDIGGNNMAITNKTTSDVSIMIKNCQIDCPASTSKDMLCNFRNNGFLYNINFNINDITAINIPALYAILRTSLSSGNATSRFIIVDKINRFPSGCYLHFSDNSYYTNVPQRLQRQSYRDPYYTLLAGGNYAEGKYNYRYWYQKPPMAFVAADRGIVTNRVIVTNVSGITNQYILVQVQSVDRNNFTATTVINVCWEVFWDDVSYL